MLFSRGDVRFVTQLFKTFEQFSTVSGLKANQAKSSIDFGFVELSVQEAILSEFNLVKGQCPFRYLGVLLSSKKLIVVQCREENN